MAFDQTNTLAVTDAIIEGLSDDTYAWRPCEGGTIVTDLYGLFDFSQRDEELEHGAAQIWEARASVKSSDASAYRFKGGDFIRFRDEWYAIGQPPEDDHYGETVLMLKATRDAQFI